jgi:hypothetical protein
MKIAFRNSIAQYLIFTGLVGIWIAVSSTNLDRSHPDSLALNSFSQICSSGSGAKSFSRTELFFGLRKADGTEVSNAEFQKFLDREVTPRFPDGFTLVAGDGQFKTDRGAIVKERSKLLILLYPIAASSNQQIEQIRKAYITAFQQQSVIRADNLSCANF